MAQSHYLLEERTMKRTLSNLLLIVVVLGMLVSCKAPA